MLKFNSSYKNNFSIRQLKNLTYPEMLKIECEFSIAIDNEIFFEEPLFPILEFLHYYANWKDENQSLSKNFNYSSMETEDNPLISFVKCEKGWLLFSPWSRFECKRCFDLKEVIGACDELLDTE